MEKGRIAPPGLFEDAFQLAYVTRDLDAAARRMEARDGLAPFSLHAIRMACTGRSDPCVARIGVSWNGDRQVELIEPVEGAVELYRDSLPPAGPSAEATAAFHHVGVKVRGAMGDWEARRDALAGAGFAIALQGGFEDRVRFAYFDMRATLGHYVELIWLGAPFLTARAAA